MPFEDEHVGDAWKTLTRKTGCRNRQLASNADNLKSSKTTKTLSYLSATPSSSSWLLPCSSSHSLLTRRGRRRVEQEEERRLRITPPTPACNTSLPSLEVKKKTTERQLMGEQQPTTTSRLSLTRAVVLTVLMHLMLPSIGKSTLPASINIASVNMCVYAYLLYLISKMVSIVLWEALRVLADVLRPPVWPLNQFVILCRCLVLHGAP